MRRLVIEGSKSLAESVVDYLQREGYEGEGAANPEPACGKVIKVPERIISGGKMGEVIMVFAAH